MERETGLEPATSSLGSWHSTTELLPLSQRPKYSTDSRLRTARNHPAWESEILALETTAFVFKRILELVSCSTPSLDSNKAGSAILDKV